MNTLIQNKIFNVLKKLLPKGMRKRLKSELKRRGCCVSNKIIVSAKSSGLSKVNINSNLMKVKATMVNDINFMFPIEYIIHTGEGKAAVPHISIWYPSFRAAYSTRTLILTRNQVAFDSISLYLKKHDYPNMVVLCKSEKDVDELFRKCVGVKACFYPSNTGNNIHPLKQTGIKHVFIGHGDSDKSASAHKFFRVYDENWVAGDANIDRFSKITTNGLQFRKVGRPNMRDILCGNTCSWSDRFSGKLNVLYLPTWEGVYNEQNYSSISLSGKISNIVNKLSVFSAKFHPMTGSRDPECLKCVSECSKDSNIFSADQPLSTFISDYNVFICDISAVVSECLSLNAPIFIYIPKDKKINLSESKMPYSHYCYVFHDEFELEELLMRVVVNKDDYLSENREQAMEYILGRNATIGNAFNKLLESGRFEDVQY